MDHRDLVERALALGLVQPDATTCGSSALVVARMVNDPSYARHVVEGPGSLRDRFVDEVLALHEVTNRRADSAGRRQPPWPRALGTQPWAVAREMTSRAGVAGTTYAARLVLRRHRARTYERIVALTGAGQAVPLFVGNRWAPRHVVLVLPGGVVVYDPARGDRYPLDPQRFAAGRLGASGWQVPWVVVVPR